MEVIATTKNEVKGEMDESYREVTGDLKKSKKPQVFRTGTNSPISVMIFWKVDRMYNRYW